MYNIMYIIYNITQDGGYGPEWKEEWGSFADHPDKFGIDVGKACCVCGGGTRHVTINDKEVRESALSCVCVPTRARARMRVREWFFKGYTHIRVPSLRSPHMCTNMFTCLQHGQAIHNQIYSPDKV